MNKEQAKIQLDKLLTEAERLKGILDTPDIELFWEPQDGTMAYWLSTFGEVNWDTSWAVSGDSSLIEIGNVFKTVELAEKELIYRKAKYALRKRIWELNDGKEYPFTYDGINYCANINIGKLEVGVWSNPKVADNWFYCKNKEACEKLIDEMSEELMIYLDS